MKQALEFAKSISEAEIEFISQADYDQETEKHKEALRKLIFEQDCVITSEQSWHPYEVVELTKNQCKNGHEREFAICNVIIGISIIAGTDITNDSQDMLESISSEYDKLDKNTKELVINLLVEADEQKKY